MKIFIIIGQILNLRPGTQGEQRTEKQAPARTISVIHETTADDRELLSIDWKGGGYGWSYWPHQTAVIHGWIWHLAEQGKLSVYEACKLTDAMLAEYCDGGGSVVNAK